MKEKLLNGIKKYRNFLLIALTVVIFAVVLTLSLVATNNANLNQGPTEPVDTTPTSFVMPILNATITKSYNAEELQYNKTLNCWEIHKGLDLLVTTGDSVVACYDGTVSDIYTNYLEGTTIEITHSNGLISVYQGLNSETSVKVGDTVTIGQTIGKAQGNVASETEDASHIHFELIKDGEKVDPLNYIEIGAKD